MKSTIAKKTEGYGYKYTELADINKFCEENDILYYQEIETCEINQKDYIITYLIKDGETTKHRGCQIVEARLSGINNPVQAYGSSLTYCRRYSLLMALGLATEDDDGASLSTPVEINEDYANNYVFNFGKHKGEKLVDVIESDNKYIQWLLKNEETSNDILKSIEILTGEKPKEIDLNKTRRLMEVIVGKGLDTDAIMEYYKVESLNDLTNEQIDEIISRRG